MASTIPSPPALRAGFEDRTCCKQSGPYTPTIGSRARFAAQKLSQRCHSGRIGGAGKPLYRRSFHPAGEAPPKPQADPKRYACL
jgi:hypothetical protein